MATVPVAEMFNDILDFLASTPTPEQIIAYRPGEQLQAHLDELVEKSKSGGLTSQEQSALDEFLRMEHFMRMLKARARKKLQQQ